MIRSETFPNSPGSVTQARHLVTAALGSVPSETRDAVEMLVSEVASNCVRHTGSEFTVRIDISAARIRIEVSDRGDGQPELRSPTPSDMSGRGLRIVELLSDRWGVIPDGEPGKTVWFEVNQASTRIDTPA